MGKAVVRSGMDTFAASNVPSRRFATAAVLQLDSGERESFLYFKSPVPRGAVVTSATLTLHARYASAGARNITLRRIEGSWTSGRLNWNNKPDAVLGDAVTTAIDAVSDGTPIQFDVTGHLQTIANGAVNRGWKVTTDATVRHLVYGFNSAVWKPTLVVYWSDAPKQPTSLRPSTGAVGTTKPTLQFDYTDVSGSTRLAAVRVQIDAAMNATDSAATADFDSGAVTTTVPELDLATTAYAGITTPTNWRVKVKDAAGLWSTWSDWAPLSYAAKNTVTITNPANIANPIVTEPTPPITWTHSGTQTAFQVRITRAVDKTYEMYDSGKQTGTETAFTLPEGVLKDDGFYAVQVRVWDDVDRESTPGSPAYASAWRDFRMDDDLGTPAITNLQATVQPDSPWTDFTWSRATMPDGFAVYVEGKHVATLDPADVFVSGTEYAWRSYLANPHRGTLFTIKAVVNGKQSAGMSRTVVTKPRGVWLIDASRNITVVLAGDDGGSWEMPDDAATYVAVGGSTTIRIVAGLRGYEGSVSGLLIDGMNGYTFEEQEADLWAIKASPTSEVRLVAGDVNIRVLIGNVVPAPTPVTRNGDIVKEVSLDFWQVSALPFEPLI